MNFRHNGEDCKLDELDLGSESTRTPVLHSKYVTLLSNSKLQLRKAVADLKRLENVKSDYYRGELSKEELDQLGWEPWRKNAVLRSDMRDQLDSDPDIIKQQDKVYYLETTVDFLDRVLRSLNSRGWDIKNAVNGISCNPDSYDLGKTKDNVHVYVEADDSIRREISDFFTFEVLAKFMPSYRNRYWDGKIRLYNINKGELYIGLVPYLLDFAKQLEYKVQVDLDPFGEKITNEEVSEFCDALKLHSQNKPIEARDYQQSAIHEGINSGRTLLLSPTASGKSLIIYSLIRYHQALGRKQLIVVPTTSLVEQMYGDFRDYSTHNGFKVAKHCHRIYGGKEKSNTADVVISTCSLSTSFHRSGLNSLMWCMVTKAICSRQSH